MKKIICVLSIMFGSLVSCQDDAGDAYPPPQTNTGVGSSSSNSTGGAGGNEITYSYLCERTGGDLISTACCDNHPFKVDTCLGEAECPLGGVSCVDVIVCDCGENNCFSLESGCQPIQ